MSHPRLLKAPARLLLLTFAISAGVAVAAPASTPHKAPMSGQAQRVTVTTRPRVRQPLEEMDAYVLLHGVPRWGLNE